MIREWKVNVVFLATISINTIKLSTNHDLFKNEIEHFILIRKKYDLKHTLNNKAKLL